MNAKYFVLVIITVLYGCAGLSNTNSTILDKKPFWSYGNYCGAGYPSTSYGIAPVDDLDRACKAHDMCYTIWRRSDSACDFVFLKNLGRLFDSNPPNYCKTIIIETMLWARTHQADDVSLYRSSILNLALIFDSAQLALLSAIMGAERAISTPVSCNRGNKVFKGFVAPKNEEGYGVMRSCLQKHKDVEDRCMRSIIER
jgi:hypothetical protein